VSVSTFRFEELGLIQSGPPYLEYFVFAVSMLMMAHLIAVTVGERHDDMIETRRWMRLYFVIGLISVTLLTVISERIFWRDYPLELSIFRAAIMLPLVVWGLLWLTRLHPEYLAFEEKNKLVIATPEIDPRDKALHASLIDEMKVNITYAKPGLTIRALSEILNTPEHRLRLLINKGMGYRNFSGFLNQYRIKAVKDAMEKEENSRIPILTLAMQVGFNSLAPFNRAFLSITGQTPTDYRAGIFKQPNQN